MFTRISTTTIQHRPTGRQIIQSVDGQFLRDAITGLRIKDKWLTRNELTLNAVIAAFDEPVDAAVDEGGYTPEQLAEMEVRLGLEDVVDENVFEKFTGTRQGEPDEALRRQQERNQTLLLAEERERKVLIENLALIEEAS